MTPPPLAAATAAAAAAYCCWKCGEYGECADVDVLECGLFAEPAPESVSGGDSGRWLDKGIWVSLPRIRATLPGTSLCCVHISVGTDASVFLLMGRTRLSVSTVTAYTSRRCAWTIAVV
jgi:hypothetical protein